MHCAFHPSRFPRRQAGMTLLELMVSLLILAAVIVAVLALFESSHQLTRTQIHRVDMQQSLRLAQREIVHMIRLAGRGGLQASADNARLPGNGWALLVKNNVEGASIIDAPGAPEVVDQTDILTIRGVINTPVYVVGHLDAAAFTLDPATQKGKITIRDRTPVGHRPQEIEILREMLTSGRRRPEALILVSAFDNKVFGVVELDYSTSDPGDARSVTLGFRYGGSAHADAYAKLSTDGQISGAFPGALFAEHRVGAVGILEEYRFYLREDRSVLPGEKAPGARRLLSRARTYPNFDGAYDATASNLRVDIAENVLDFQVALGFDPNADGVIEEAPGGDHDEWLGNSPNDDATRAPWTKILAGAAPSLSLLRLTTLARSAEVDRRHEAKELVRLEDREYTATDPLNRDPIERRYPRILLRTSVEMRNL